MKKRDLLLTGLLLCTIAVLGQTTPPRYADDAKVIFMQDFESASKTFQKKVLNTDPNRPTTLYTWNATPVDQITQITYYKMEGHKNPDGGSDIYNGKKEFEVAGIRDTLMELFDGVMRTDAVQPDDSLLNFDTHAILDHTAETQNGLDLYGEKGGSQYFSYSSATSKGENGKTVANRTADGDGGYVPEYRRNVFVRHIPIEENSSYRVTVFVRPTSIVKKSSNKSTPRIGLDLMRGYFHSEKPFLVEGKKATSSPAAFDDKSNYTNLKEGEWNKIILMSYYNNDSIGDASAYLASYYWQGDWDWTVGRDAEGNVVNDLGRGKARNAANELVNSATAKDTTTLTFIKQPNKYFVRLSLRSDSTKFDVDNLSLTRSWIGGVEHHNDMIRVNFGYETNMGALAQAALEKNKIAAVELPGEYFTVWARMLNKKSGERKWQVVPINSAEYHGDGYMYMWTKPWEDDGSIRSFELADSVLVSFTNPVDRDDLKLLYTGSRYPNGADQEWQKDKNKRLVYNFHNEISSLNPNIDYSGNRKVLSLKDLPPVMQRAPYEDGTFGLDPNMKEMTFKFSRQLVYENTGDENTDISFIKVVGKSATEYWEFKDYADENDTNTVIVRPSKYNTPLSGDYTINILQITHLDDAVLTDPDLYGAPVTLNLHFGDFEVSPANPIAVQTDWRSEITEKGAWNRPTPPSLWSSNLSQGFYHGTGENFDPRFDNGLYKMEDDGVHGDCFYYLSNGLKKADGGDTQYAHLYSPQTLAAGTYKLSFYAFGWARNSLTTNVYLYAKPATMDEPSLEAARDAAGAAAKIGDFKPSYQTSWSGSADQHTWKGSGGWGDSNVKGSDVKLYEINFTITTPGDYVFDWSINNDGSQAYYGVAICNFKVERTGLNMTVKPVRSIIDALDAANAQIAKADAATQYKGSAYQTLKDLVSSESSFVANKKASGSNVPSEYAAEAEMIQNAIKTQKTRVDLIDGFFKTLDEAQAKYEHCDTAAEYAAYRSIPDIDALLALKNSYANYNYAAANNAAITAEQNKVKAAIEGIDKRVALGKVYPDAVTYAKAMKDTAVAHSLAVTALTTAITDADNFNANTATYAELRAKMTALTDLAFATVYQDTLQVLSTRRIKELDSIAQSLGATYPEGVAARIAAVTTDDDEVADIIKCAIKIAIYDKIVKGENVANVDLTPFIKNYFLYATVKGILDNSTLELPDSRNDAKAQALQGAAQIQKIGHKWGQDALGKKCWVMILNQEYTDLYPGWTAESFVTGNHSMVTPDEGYGNLSKDTLVNQGMVFDGKLAMDWNSKAELKQSIAGLPAGIYTLGAKIGGSGINSANLTITSDVQTYTKDIKTDMKSDNFMVLEQAIDIDYVIESGSGSPSTDDFSLTYVGKNDDPWFYEANNYYPTLLANAQSELDNLVTIVDKAKAVAAGVEFYTISGIKLDAPKAGEVLIRKTTNSNGKVVVDKVIIK